MRNYSPVLCALAAVLVLPSFCAGQASINEGLETAFIYVDAVNGSDSNPGTQAQPLKTISAGASIAQANNQKSIGTRVTINPGTYRESVSLTHSNKDTSLPITFEAATNGTVIVSGATLFTAWATYSPNPNIFTNSWTHDWGVCPQNPSCNFQQDIMMRREMVVVNGAIATQVMSIAQMQQGTFYVDEQGGQIYVYPAAGTNMGTATVEVGSLASLFSISHKSYIVVRGITFQYASSCRSTAAVTVTGQSTNILFDTDTFQWNNGQGLGIESPTTLFTVQNSVALHNGDSGLQESRAKNGLWQTVSTSYNNWRGAQGGFYACNTAGLAAWEVHEDTLNGFTTSFNESYGIHWDTNNININATTLNATSNLMSGVFVEKDDGPVTFTSSYFCNQNSALGVGGLVVRNSEGVSVTKSVLMNNLPSQIIIIGAKGGIEVTNWETGKTNNLITENFSNTSNTIQGTTSSQLVFQDSYLDGSDWTSFQNTLKSSSNTWWNALNTTTAFVVPEPKTGTKETFSGWQSSTLQDSTSSFKAPSGTPGAACALTPVGTDYWVTVDKALLTASKGKSVTYNVTVTPLNFTGTANLTLDGISEVKGLTATLSANSIQTSGTTALTVTAGTTTASGTYTITVLANSGSLTRTVSVQIKVN
jgi:hypothetical protein